jgi:multidrug efflux pump subunit AcrA (membrane-fusion protein)
MKLNVLFPWMCVVGLATGMGAVYLSGRTKDAELATLRAESQQTQLTREKLEQAESQARAQLAEIDSLRKDKQELLRLRAEINKLHDDKTQLDKKLQLAQAESQRVQAGAQQAQQQLQNENAQLRNSAAQNVQNAQRIGCINILRQMDAAKQQWALQNNKTADAIPTPQDLAPYFNNSLPSCPGGGTYTINAVGQLTTCTIPGHALPRQ